ncbi:MAG: helix-turn-helix domain-containing protein [Bacteroidales bacterium]|nr:helix-turn-helix domain-containing protein [Bacteroidales bacterium]
MKERLQQLLNKEQLTPVRFAEIVGVQRSSVSHILSGRNNPSLDFIQKILLKFPQISSDWLINGIGALYRDNVAHKQAKTPGLFEQTNEEDQAPYLTQSAIKEADSHQKPMDDPTTERIEQSPDHTPGASSSQSEIERIVVFYRDRSFREYKPE